MDELYEDGDKHPDWRILLFLMAIQAMVNLVSSLTGRYTDGIFAFSFWHFLIAVILSLIFQTTKVTSKQRWWALWLTLLNFSSLGYYILLISGVVFQQAAMPYISLFGLQTSIILLYLCRWVSVWFAEKFPPAENIPES